MITVSPADVRIAAYGVNIPAGQAIDNGIARLINKALVRVYNAFPSIDDRIERSELTEDTVKGVVEDMVIRVLRNPNAYRQVSIDDFLRQIDTAVSSGQLYLSPEERALLSPRRRAKRARSVRLHTPSWRLP